MHACPSMRLLSIIATATQACKSSRRRVCVAVVRQVSLRTGGGNRGVSQVEATCKQWAGRCKELEEYLLPLQKENIELRQERETKLAEFLKTAGSTKPSRCVAWCGLSTSSGKKY